jgi:hypothetical protein
MIDDLARRYKLDLGRGQGYHAILSTNERGPVERKPATYRAAGGMKTKTPTRSRAARQSVVNMARAS